MHSMKQSLYSNSFYGPSPLWYTDVMVHHSNILIKSYFKITNEELVPLNLLKTNPEKAAKELFFLEDRVVLSHGIQEGETGPILNYGNSVALKLWKASWEQLSSLPSKYTADEQERAQRADSMRKVLENGYVSNYEGIRCSLDKSKFRIKNTTIWNIYSDDNVMIGQAASFNAWEYL